MKKVANVLVLVAVALLVTPCYAKRPATTVASGVKAYDANGQFVGVLVGIAPNGYMTAYGQMVRPGVTVFIPGLGKFIQLTSDGQYLEESFDLDYLWYRSVNCDAGLAKQPYGYPYTGSEIIDPNFISGYIAGDGIPRFFTIGQWEVEVQLQSRTASGSDVCMGNSPNPGGYPLTEVTLPFTFPLALPLSFE